MDNEISDCEQQHYTHVVGSESLKYLDDNKDFEFHQQEYPQQQTKTLYD